MNIKIYINTFMLGMFVLILSEISTSNILTTESHYQTHQTQSFFQYIEQLIANLFHEKKENNSLKKTSSKENKKSQELQKIIKIPTTKTIENETKTSSSLSRNEALEIIRLITAKVFDINDPYHISVHLEDLKRLTENLDPIIDKKTITAIHFLIENQHRTSYLDAIFWIKNMKEKELDSSIPVTEEVFKMSKTDKLKILQVKLSAKKPKEEEEEEA